ncbi:MAG: 8-oxo-dGTP pyrophosphatase MutT (NUDIX family) [Planktomarina sp.]|jgi:8-oxo-dGTP pyrophosphatase MutT (NUDIX family)|tara:strand:- start:1198 stop:1689 length:492 start_codon:yes stop_codon:yes gene_type:complete
MKITSKMSSTEPTQLPLSIETKRKRNARSQFGALCYRVTDGKIQILLISSRRTKRWILPKGWPENGMTPGESAANEAMEEAGVTGMLNERPLGVYCYEKNVANGENYPCIVTIYALKVKKTWADYPEKSERRRKWFGRKGAAKRVFEPELALLIKSFDPLQGE